MFKKEKITFIPQQQSGFDSVLQRFLLQLVFFLEHFHDEFPDQMTTLWWFGAFNVRFFFSLSQTNVPSNSEMS